MAKRSLVTGGLGFIGRHLVEQLQAAGEQVRVLDLHLPEQPLPGVEYLQGSVLDQDQVRTAMEGVEWVFHLAANANLWAPRQQDFITLNQLGTRQVLHAALDVGIKRLVHTSTEAVLKNARQPPSAVINESILLTLEDMAGPYCRSKFLAEQEVQAAVARGLEAVIVNPSLPIGPGDHHLTPPSRMILGFLNGDYPAFLESTFNLIDVRDVAQGHILAAEKGLIGERYILGSQDVHLSQLLQMLEDLTGLPMPKNQIPYWLAFSFSLLEEFLADHITHQPPSAPLTGVKLARFHANLDTTKAKQKLELICRPITHSLLDTLRWLDSNQLLKRVALKNIHH
ncbi:MAG: NAD-dependent epimerase/dehydratase family protein [Synechococcaceae cyanobacterium SM2_3_1]|nr:NAD-dependent epimerase/dehydratase family protein [Synechococcaceae cyanobacterium SM2_3_1]